MYSDGRESRWNADEVEESRKAILEEFIDERDDFVARHEATLLEALGQEWAPVPLR